MRRTLLLGSGVVLLVASVALAPAAQAACHAFEATVSPANPAEGAAVEVTVTRDAGVNPSSVRVRTVDGTATAGQDYEAVDRRIEYTAEVEQTFAIRTLQDPADEPGETFRIELSEGAGCQINPNFTYEPATVTIQDDDAPAPAPTAAPTTAAPATTAAAGTTATTEGAPEETTSSTAPDETTSSTIAPEDATSTTDATTTTLEAEEALGVEEDDDGVSAGWVILAVVLVAAAAAGTYWLLRGRAGRVG